MENRDIDIELFKRMELCRGMGDPQLCLLQESAYREEYEAGCRIFSEGDEGNCLYFVVSGLVEITASVGRGVEKTLSKMPPGSSFGEMALIEGRDRSASARAAAKTVLISIGKERFIELIESDHSFAAHVLINLARTLSRRLRSTTTNFRQSLEWNLKISGATELNLQELIRGPHPIRLRLQGQEEIRGVLLQVEKSQAGHELLVQDDFGKLFVVPYHAVQYIHMDSVKTIRKDRNL